MILSFSLIQELTKLQIFKHSIFTRVASENEAKFVKLGEVERSGASLWSRGVSKTVFRPCVCVCVFVQGHISAIS